MDARLQKAVVGDNVGRVTGHEKRLEIGAKALDLICQFAAVHLGHHHIDEKHLDSVGMAFGQIDGFALGPCGKNRVA